MILKVLLPLLLSVSCLLCSAQEDRKENDLVELYYKSSTKLFAVPNVEEAQKIFLSPEVQQLSSREQYELLIDQYAYGENTDIIQALIDQKLKLALSQQEQKDVQVAFEKDGNDTPLEAILCNSYLDDSIRFNFATQLLQQTYTMNAEVLRTCCASGELPLLKFCVANGANGKEAGFHGLSCLNPDEMTDILDEDASVEDIKNATDYQTAKELALKECFYYLLEQGAEVNTRNTDGQTATHMACADGNLSLLKLLEKEGADFTLKDKQGRSALHDISLTYSKNAFAIVDLMLSHGLKIDDADQDGFTPLLDACLTQSVELAEYYIKKGATVTAKNKEGYSVLHEAISDDNENTVEIIELLLKCGADINATDSEGRTPLIYACYFDNSDVVNLLIEAGADLEVKGTDGDNALHSLCYMVEVNELTNIEILLKHGANINALTADKSTPLLLACFMGRNDIAQCLINYGADATQTVNGVPPLVAALFGALYYHNGDIFPLIWQHQQVTGILNFIVSIVYIFIIPLTPFIILLIIIIQKRNAKKRKGTLDAASETNGKYQYDSRK